MPLKWSRLIFWKQRECKSLLNLRREGANDAHDTVRIEAIIKDSRAMMRDINTRE